MKPKSWPILMAVAALLLGLVAVWNLVDALRGAFDLESIIWAAVMLPLSIGMAIISVRAWSRREPSAQVPVSLDPVTIAERKQSMWRIAKWAIAVSALLITLSTISWAVRSGTLWTPVFVGAISLTTTIIILTVVFRPNPRP